MDGKYCQSCGMPLVNDGDFGTNKDGSRNDDYCAYCYKSGDFTRKLTMDEMIEHCTRFAGDMGMTKEQAVAAMEESFPKLKRWAGN